MSYWSYVDGIINVDVYGNSQKECDKNIEEIVKKLPCISGSEGNADIYTNVHSGCNHYENFKSWQSGYTLTIHGSLRDRFINNTYTEVEALVKFIQECDNVFVNQVSIEFNGYIENITKRTTKYFKIENRW